MADIKNNGISWTGKNTVQGYGKLNYPQITCQMTAIFCNSMKNFLSDFLRKFGELRFRYLFYIFW